jgi:hypothetical protein
MAEVADAQDARGVPLAEMIESLRQELQSSRERGRGQAVSFQIEKVELELKVAVSRKVKGEGGVEFWVVKAGASAEGSREMSHTFKLTLSPIASDSGSRLKVNENTDVPAARS